MVNEKEHKGQLFLRSADNYNMDINKEAQTLYALASLHEDHDNGLAITEADLKDPKAEAILNILSVDDAFVDIPSVEKAKRLTTIYQTLQISSKIFSSGNSSSPKEIATLEAADKAFRAELDKRFPQPQEKKELPFDPQEPFWKEVVQNNTLQISEKVYAELQSSYDGEVEQGYLLLANRQTKVIEKAIRPKHFEAALTFSFNAGWVEYVGSLLKRTDSPYAIVGTYHSHPKLSFSDMAKAYGPTFPSSVMDGRFLPLASLQLIGHADEKDFQVKAYDKMYLRGLKIVPSNTPPVLNDLSAENFEPHKRGEVELGLTPKQLALFIQSGPKKDPKLKVTYFYDGSYEAVLNFAGETTHSFTLIHQMHTTSRGGWSDENGYVGQLSAGRSTPKEISQMIENIRTILTDRR